MEFDAAQSGALRAAVRRSPALRRTLMVFRPKRPKCPAEWRETVSRLRDAGGCTRPRGREREEGGGAATERVFYVWEGKTSAFGDRQRVSVESVFRHHPCAVVLVMTVDTTTELEHGGAG